MPKTSFRVRLNLVGQDAFQKIQRRVLDLREVWNQIVDRWLVSNKAKFDEGRGAQLSGVEFDAEDEPVMWLGVTDDYAAAKSAAGFENWLMVRTGELKTSLTERGGIDWWEDLGKMEARFGTENRKEVWHREKRPVMFLSADDRQMIRDMIGAWFNGLPPFRQYVPSETKRYDAKFQARMADPRA